MGKPGEVLDEAKEDFKDVPRKSGPAGLVVIFYIVTAIVGIVLIGLYLWWR
jgi:hypothetical protein